MMEAESDLTDVGERIEALLSDLRTIGGPDIALRAEELVAALVGFYGAGLARLVRDLPVEVVRPLADDPLVASLLLLHGLHPDDTETRIQRALAGARVSFELGAADVELLGIDPDGMARLRYAAAGNGCGASGVSVRTAIEQAIIEAAPEIQGVRVVTPGQRVALGIRGVPT